MGAIITINRLLFIFVICSIVLFISFNIFFNLTFHKKNIYKPSSKFSDWNNEKTIKFKKLTFNQWRTTFSGIEREFIHVCNSWNYDSIFKSKGEIVSYYDNKYNGLFEDSEISYLRKYNGEILYIIENKPFQTVKINNILTPVKFLIKDSSNRNMGYVERVDFNQDNFDIKNIEGIKCINIKRRIIDSTDITWEYTRTSNNIFPLSLAVGISSKISFYNNSKDFCNIVYRLSYIVMLLSFFIILYTIIRIMFILIKRGRFR